MSSTEWQAVLCDTGYPRPESHPGTGGRAGDALQYGDYECPRPQAASRGYAKNLGPPRPVGHGSGSL